MGRLDNLKIRNSIFDDYPQVLALIQELANYEKCPNEVKATVESMINDSEHFNCIVTELENQIVGTAIFFPYYSTWKGRCIYLEDIVVTEKLRNKGVGKLLFDEVIKSAKEFGAKRLMWQVLDWNEPAINFYKKINTNFDGEWLNCKLTEEQIENYQAEN